MAYDPTKIITGSRLWKDKDASGVIVDSDGEWVSGEIEIEVLDANTGNTLGSTRIKTTRKKYDAWREDYDDMSKQEILDTYFPDVDTSEPSETELARTQREADEATEAKKKEVADREAQEADDRTLPDRKEKYAVRSNADGKPESDKSKTRTRTVKQTPVTNVRPVGDPDETPSNPEQALTAEEMIAKGASSVGSPVGNPEQSAPNVPEDKFDKVGGNDTTPANTNDVKRNVVPAGGEAKTNKEVTEA